MMMIILNDNEKERNRERKRHSQKTVNERGGTTKRRPNQTKPNQSRVLARASMEAVVAATAVQVNSPSGSSSSLLETVVVGTQKHMGTTMTKEEQDDEKETEETTTLLNWSGTHSVEIKNRALWVGNPRPRMKSYGPSLRQGASSLGGAATTWLAVSFKWLPMERVRPWHLWIIM